MRRAATDEGVKRSGLLRRFVLISLISIGPTALLTGWLTASLIGRSLLDRERDVTVRYVQRLVADEIPPEALRALGRAESLARVRHVGEQLLRLPEAVRVKVFDRDGTVVWSDATGLVGLNFRDDPQLRESLGGAAVVALETIRPVVEHAYEVGRYRELTAIYVPVADPDTGRVLVVFELYKLPDLFLTWIRRGQVFAWLAALGVGALLGLAQLSLVRKAARTIAGQHEDLDRRARQLEAMNADLRTAQRQLVEAERLAAFGEATVAVAHGLRNPLANIRAVAQETLETIGPAGALGEPLGDIIAQVDRLEARLRAFLSSTRPFDMTPAPQRIDDVVGAVVASVDRQLAERGVKVHVEVERGAPPVHGDRTTLEQAVQEVLVNSLEAGATVIRVRARTVPSPDGVRVAVDVDDDGGGFTPAARAHALEPLFTTKAQGTGMGLVAVRRIVEAHGGTVSVGESPDGGARVTLLLPAARAGGQG